MQDETLELAFNASSASQRSRSFWVRIRKPAVTGKEIAAEPLEIIRSVSVNRRLWSAVLSRGMTHHTDCACREALPDVGNFITTLHWGISTSIPMSITMWTDGLSSRKFIQLISHWSAWITTCNSKWELQCTVPMENTVCDSAKHR